ncbi:hypothetical protein EIP86_000252, partial [Pleurotus ostreatoroseus]
MRAFNEIYVHPEFDPQEAHLTRASTGVLCAVVGTAVAVASTAMTGYLPQLLHAEPAPRHRRYILHTRLSYHFPMTSTTITALDLPTLASVSSRHTTKTTDIGSVGSQSVTYCHIQWILQVILNSVVSLCAPFIRAVESASQPNPLRSRLRILNRKFQALRAYAVVSISQISDTQAATPPPEFAEKNTGGSLVDFFAAFSASAPLPQRFTDLKKSIFTEQLVQSWREVLSELAVKTDEVAATGANIIPQVDYTDFERGLSKAQVQAIKDTGVVIVKGGEALGWKQSIREYVRANIDLVKGIPQDNIVFYEIYNSKAQLAARTHPALLHTQHTLCGLWHASDPSTLVNLDTQISYFDRLRIRPPGPSVFTLGCHIDGGSLERWEDPGFRACFGKIFEGKWREHDPFDVTPRIGAKQDLYDSLNQCTVFRPWQGWTSLSSTGAHEGTLRVLPFLTLSTAYIMLRPFFRLKASAARQAGASGTVPLGFDAWEVNLDGSEFPGSEMGKGQMLNDLSHPHLKLDQTMMSIPKVEPGDQVYFESEHTGKTDSSVLYIPAVPLTVQ